MKQPSIIGQEALESRQETDPVGEFWNVLTDDYFRRLAQGHGDRRLLQRP